MGDLSINFEQVVRRGCGIDIHKDSIVATVSGEGISTETRTFTTYTNDLHKLKDWLLSFRITHVAMESTGIYWKPIFNIIESDFEILLVNARHIKNVPGHKTDKKDSRWITKLLLSGLLKSSFIPPKDIRELRDLFRYRRKLTFHLTSEKNRIEKILQDANFKISTIISDTFGVSGTKILDALLCDNNDIDYLVSLCHGKIRQKEKELREALVGELSEHHKFMLHSIRKSMSNIESLISELDKQIEQQSKSYQLELKLLQTIPGVDKIGSVAILSEIGADMSKFPSEHHLASWAGLCPGNNESAGKKKVAE